MFADPTYLVAAIPDAVTNAALRTGTGLAMTTFTATGRGPLQSTYRYDYSSTNWVELLIGRQSGRRNRYTVRLTESEIVADPLDTTKNSVKTSSIYVVADFSLLGKPAHFVEMCNALADVLITTSDLTSPPLSRVIAGET